MLIKMSNWTVNMITALATAASMNWMGTTEGIKDTTASMTIYTTILVLVYKLCSIVLAAPSLSGMTSIQRTKVSIPPFAIHTAKSPFNLFLWRKSITKKTMLEKSGGSKTAEGNNGRNDDTCVQQTYCYQFVSENADKRARK